MSTLHPGVRHLDSSSFATAIKDGLVLVDFWAPWCGPCRMLAPMLDAVAAQTPGVTVAKLDIDQAPELANTYQVQSIPCMVLFQNGKEIDRRVGLLPLPQVQAWIQHKLERT